MKEKRTILRLAKGISHMSRKPTSSIPELERRMRPGGFSSVGFLGPTESLEAVLARDDQTLKELGLSHDQVANALEDVLRSAFEQRAELFERDSREYRKRERGGWPSPGKRSLSADKLPRDMGYLVRDVFQVCLTVFRGLQECPWGCKKAGGGSANFLILNRQLGQWLTGPDLIVHLIREHHFFEGVESPYRVDPSRAARVLGLVSAAGPG